MMNKVLAYGGATIAGLVGVAQTFASEYTISGATVTSLGGAATDTANSLFGSMGSLLPVMIPLIVVGFGIGLVKSFLHKRG